MKKSQQQLTTAVIVSSFSARRFSCGAFAAHSFRGEKKTFLRHRQIGKSRPFVSCSIPKIITIMCSSRHTRVEISSSFGNGSVRGGTSGAGLSSQIKKLVQCCPDLGSEGASRGKNRVNDRTRAASSFFWRKLSRCVLREKINLLLRRL